MLYLLIDIITEKIIKRLKHRKTLTFAFLKNIISKVLYKSRYHNISIGLPVYLLESLFI